MMNEWLQNHSNGLFKWKAIYVWQTKFELTNASGVKRGNQTAYLVHDWKQICRTNKTLWLLSKLSCRHLRGLHCWLLLGAYFPLPAVLQPIEARAGIETIHNGRQALSLKTGPEEDLKKLDSLRHAWMDFRTLCCCCRLVTDILFK